MQTVLDCDNSVICVPCAGTPADCNTGSTSVVACDDMDSCTENDVQTILDSNPSIICVPCEGTPVDCGSNSSCETTQPCDDMNPCTENDVETILNSDGTVCQPCAGTPIDCSNGATSVVACDDGNPNTINDVQTILDCDGSICVPCAGVPGDCDTAPTSVVPCDDGNPCTINDMETILDSDGSVCVPCAGTMVDCNTGATSVVACDDGNPNTINDVETILDCNGSVCVPCMGSLAACNITSGGLENIRCNPNGTPSDPADDYITFDLNPTGIGLSNIYNLSGAITTPSSGTYGTVTNFATQTGTAGLGDINLVITDDTDTNCSINVIVEDPGTCENCPTIEATIIAPSGICAGESFDLQFNITGGQPPYNLSYTDDQGLNNLSVNVSGISSVSVSPSGTITYTITEVLDADNCPAIPGASATVEVFAEAINSFADAFCEGEMYRLPDGTMVDTADDYEVVLSGQSVNGCDSTIRISLTQNPKYDFGETVIVCDSEEYLWNGQTYNEDGTYTASFQSIDGCDSLHTLNLTFDGLAIYGAANAGADAEECLPEGELFGLDVSGTNGVWNSPTGAIVTPMDQGAAIATNLQSGANLFVWSISTDECVDFSRDTAVITYIENAIELNADFGVFRNSDPIQVEILTNDNLGGVNEFEVSCFDLPNEITNCVFDESSRVLNIDLASNAIGTLEFSYAICSDACPELCDTTIVRLDISNDLDQTDYIITPANKDGLNDVLVFDNLDQFPENELIIYNRWGSIVYRAQPYANDWDGLHRGKQLPEADYYYILRKKLPGEIEFGLVTIKY